MTRARFLTFNDRRYRREKIIAAWQAGECSRTKSREIAERYGLSRNHVNSIVREAGLRSISSEERGSV